jgi:hypothetical protein
VQSPSRQEILGLGPVIVILVVLGLVVAVVGPHPEYLLHRVLPFESGPAGEVGQHFSTEDEFYLALHNNMECVSSSASRSCDYVAQLDPPPFVSKPMLRLLYDSPAPAHNERFRVDVVGAAGIPADLAPTHMSPTEQRTRKGSTCAVPPERSTSAWSM